MSKRFTDTDKWKKTWYRKLKPQHKVFWSYICDQCDNAGIWEVDFELAENFVGESLDASDLMDVFQKQIHHFHGGRRWFILDFITFQYGELKHTNNAHRSVLASLNRYHLTNIYQTHLLSREENPAPDQPLMSPSQGAQDKDKDKDKDSSLPPKEEIALYRLPSVSQEAVALAAQAKHSQTATTQAHYDRARTVFDAYPILSARSGRAIRKDMHSLNVLASKIAAAPDFDWEAASRLEGINDTPQDLSNWLSVQPDPVMLETRRKQSLTAPPPKPGERIRKPSKALT